MFDQEEPTLDLNNSTMLAKDIVGEVTIEMSRLPAGDVVLDVSLQGEAIKVERFRDMTDFRAGCVFEHEVSAYRALVR
jgi:hypothetical protein